MWSILKSLLNLLQYCSCFIYLFWLQDMLARWPRIEPAPSVLEGEVLTTGLPGKSLDAPSFFPLIWPSPSPLSFVTWQGTDRVWVMSLVSPANTSTPQLQQTPAGETLQPGSTWLLLCACSQMTFSDDLQFSSLVESCLTLCDSKLPHDYMDNSHIHTWLLEKP